MSSVNPKTPEQEAKDFQEGVIKEVINNLHEVFQKDGVPEEYLEKLKNLWKMKLTEKSQPKQLVQPHHHHHMIAHNPHTAAHHYPHGMHP